MILTQIDSSSLLSTSGLTTLVILFMSLAIFGWLAVRYRNIRSFEFQISIFIMVYIVGEIIEDYNKNTFLFSFSLYWITNSLGSSSIFIYNIMDKAILRAKEWKKDN